MPRYFYHRYDASCVIKDTRGAVEYSSARARWKAIQIIRSAVSEALRNGILDLSGEIVVTDEKGDLLHEISFGEAFDVYLPPALGASSPFGYK